MTELIPRTAITEIVGLRNAAIRKMREAVDAMVSGAAAADSARELAQQAAAGATFYHADRTRLSTYQRLFEPIRPDESMEAFRQQVDASVWTHLLSRTGMDRLMDRTALEAFRADLCSSVPEVTEESVYATLSGLSQDARLIFLRGLANAFISLDRRFRSHDAFKIGERVILTRVFDGMGHWNYHTDMRATITDLERVFAVLDGHPESVGSLVEAIDRDRGHGWSARQSLTESTYFRVRGFQNGNAHLWMRRDDLVQRANEMLAEYYGAVLPDAVPGDVVGDALRSFALSRDLAFYPTPDAVVRAVLTNLGIDGSAHVLEPSAGTGNIVRHLLNAGARVHAVEVHPERAQVLRGLRSPRLVVEEANFLQVPARAVYSHVVMNPPFAGTHWMAHVRHAMDFVAPGGTLLAILPVTAELGTSSQHEDFRAWAKPYARYGGNLDFRDLPAESFAESGTRVNTVTLTLYRRSRRS